MKPEELACGDWVYSSFYYEQPCQILGIELYEQTGYANVKTTEVVGAKDINSLSPIPLTRDIMEKNFEITYNNSEIYKNFDCPFFIIPRSNGKTAIALWSHEDGTPFIKVGDVHYIRCYYVHQLQHLLKLIGSEKEIIL